jgi:anti-sigma B factor antagonist
MLRYSAEAATAEDIVMAAQDDLERNASLALSHWIRPAGEAVVELTGDLDIATAEMAVSYVTDVIKRHHEPLTIDLSALDFCGAQGLAALVRMAGCAEQKDRPFRLASPRPSLIKIMRITGLDRRFSFGPADHRDRPLTRRSRPSPVEFAGDVSLLDERQIGSVPYLPDPAVMLDLRLRLPPGSVRPGRCPCLSPSLPGPPSRP